MGSWVLWNKVRGLEGACGGRSERAQLLHVPVFYVGFMFFECKIIFGSKHVESPILLQDFSRERREGPSSELGGFTWGLSKCFKCLMEVKEICTF